MPQGPELHPDVSSLQRHVLLLEVSTTQGPELHLELSTVHKEAFPARGGVYTI
jgi:hypothetical protein